MSARQHQSSACILDRRTLHQDHRALAEVLAPGMSVLDVGCGTGAITRGIAEAVGPAGAVVGVDRDGDLIARARAHGRLPPNLRFEQADAANLGFERQFDVVTAARTLQWIGDAGAAIASMVRAAKPGGLIVLLDYNHARNGWHPAPPPEFAAFYDAFLSWRRANGWDNEMGVHLAERLREAGLLEVRGSSQAETAHAGDCDFAARTALWTEVIDSLAPALEKSGFCTAAGLRRARNVYEEWRTTRLVRQTLSLNAAVARTPRRGTTGSSILAGSILCRTPP